MLAVAIVHLHHVIEGRVEEGELSKHHCGGDSAESSVWKTVRPCRGAEGRSGGPEARTREASEGVVASWGELLAEPFYC